MIILKCGVYVDTYDFSFVVCYRMMITSVHHTMFHQKNSTSVRFLTLFSITIIMLCILIFNIHARLKISTCLTYARSSND